jgi:hypothetical protein
MPRPSDLLRVHRPDNIRRKKMLFINTAIERIVYLLDANKALPVITDIYGKTAAHTSNLQHASW